MCAFVKVVDTELFKCLQDIHGEGYDGFIARKLVPVVGDVREANVGIAPDLADEIADQVDVIINSAANTTFDERCVIDASSQLHSLFFSDPCIYRSTAASTLHWVWSHRYDVAMDINTVGPFRIMSFAQRFRRLKLFLQVSTGRSSE